MIADDPFYRYSRPAASFDLPTTQVLFGGGSVASPAPDPGWAERGGGETAVATSAYPFEIVPVEGEAKVIVRPGLANGVLPTIGGDGLDGSPAPKLTVVSGPVYVEIHYRGALTLSAAVKNAASLPANIAGVSPRFVQIGTVTVSGGEVTAVVQLAYGHLTATLIGTPWRMTGYIEGGSAKIHLVPALVGQAVPTVGGTSLAAATPPAITVTGTSGQIWAEATVDGAFNITALALANLTSPPTDNPGSKYYKLVGTWTASGGQFTSCVSLLSRNITLFFCAGSPIWEAAA